MHLTLCVFLRAGADEEYIYMNKVLVTGKGKGDKGESFRRITVLFEAFVLP